MNLEFYYIAMIFFNGGKLAESMIFIVQEALDSQNSLTFLFRGVVR